MPRGLGIVTTAAVILAVGVVATNVLGKRVLQRAEGYLLRIPVFRTVYAPVKQLVLAFSPDNEYGFKRVVHDSNRVARLYTWISNQGVLHRVGRSRPSRSSPSMSLPIISILATWSSAGATHAFFPDLSVEEGIRVFLTGGMTLPAVMPTRSPDNVTERS